MDDPIIKPPNPFVGPRAILENEPFFGRETELNDLVDQLYAERVVLMYSPSGAGKTSLINAGLVPQLKTSFAVLPTLRLNRALPDELSRGKDINRYSGSVVSSLYSPGNPPDWQLSSYPFGEAPILLIFDQFEEIITLEQADVEQKRDFFKELGSLLKRSNLWALFALREDYLAALDPYRLTIPGELRSRFRLDLFTRQQAIEVMVKTADTKGVRFRPQAAERLANVLSGSPVGAQPEGPSPPIGQYVEPVHVQLVCFDLWEKKLRPEGREITLDMVEASGGVDEALARFYASSLEKIAAQKGVKERQLRNLFENDLITKNNIRAQVQLGHPGLVGLENAVDALKDVYLLRSDVRHGTTWYELAHDRLIYPIRSDNQTWFERHLSPHQSGAIAWDRAGRRPGLLLHGAELDKAEAWETANPDDPLTDLEEAYLEASLKARIEEENERQREEVKKEKKHLEERGKQQRRWIIILATLVFVMGLLIILNVKNYQTALINLKSYYSQEAAADLNSAQVQKERATVQGLDAQVATEQAQKAKDLSVMRLVNQLAVDGLDALDISRQLSLLLAAEAVNRARALGPAEQPAVARQALIAALARPNIQPMRGHTGPVKTLAVSTNGSWLATGGTDGTVRLWNLATGDPGNGLPLNEQENFGPVSSLAFSPDGAWLVFGTINGCLVLSTPSEAGESGYRISGYYCQGDKQVQQVIISPDSRWLAAASADQDLWLFDLSNPGDLSSSLLSLPGLVDSVTSLTFSPDSRWLATGSLDGGIQVWEVSGLRDVAWADLQASPPPANLELTGHTGPVAALDFSPDTRWLASGSQDGFIRLWDFQAENPQAEPYVLDNQATGAEALDFSPDGRLLAIAGGNLTSLWDIQALSQKKPGEANPGSYAALNPIFHSDHIRDLAFSPEEGSPYLATASGDGVVRLVFLEPVLQALQEGKRPAEIELSDAPLLGHQSQINDLAFSPDGQTLFTASEDLTVIDWPLEGIQQPIPTILEHQGSVNIAVFSPDSERAVTTSDDGAARIWKAASWQDPPLVLRGHEGSIRGAAFSPDGERLVTASDDGTARIWNAASGEELAVLRGHEGSIRSVAFSPRGEWVVTASDDGTARIWDSFKGTELVVLSGHEGGVHSAVFSPDGQWAATASDDGTARIWDISSSNQLAVLRGHENYVNNAVFSPDGAWLVTSSDDGTARIWDSINGMQLAVLRGHKGSVRLAVFSPDGQRLATGSEDGTIRLWDLKSASSLGEDPIILPDPGGGISALTFDPTGRWLASGNSAGTGRLWDLAAKDPASQAIELPAHKDWINSIGFSPDGEWLVTASNDGTAHLWQLPLDAESLIDLACQAAGPQATLTQEKWDQYLPGVEYDPTCPR